MDVLVGYDGSEAARRALGAALQLVGDGRLTIAHVAQLIVSGVPDPRWSEEQEAVLTEAAELVPGAALLDLTGDPAHELCEAAKRTGADVVVVGTRGHGALGRALLGSVSSGVVRHAPCSVLVVP